MVLLSKVILDLNSKLYLKFNSFFVAKTLRFQYKDVFVDTWGKIRCLFWEPLKKTRKYAVSEMKLLLLQQLSFKRLI